MKPSFEANISRQLWDINPETQKPVELEEIPDIDELENNELLVDASKLTFSLWNLSLRGDLFKRVVYFTIKFFEGGLFEKGDLFKRVVTSRAYGISIRMYSIEQLKYETNKKLSNTKQSLKYTNLELLSLNS